MNVKFSKNTGIFLNRIFMERKNILSGLKIRYNVSFEEVIQPCILHKEELKIMGCKPKKDTF